MEKIENTIARVNPTWSKDLIIRYVIVELAPYFRRDLYYFTSSSQKQIELFNSGYRPTSPEVFCVTLCEEYQRILSRFDIRSVIIQANPSLPNAVPLYSLIVQGDNGWFYINPLKDLWMHQLGLKSYEFGCIPNYNKDFVMACYPNLKILAPEYVAELDQELGFVNNTDCFKPEVIGGKDLNHYRLRKGLGSKSPIIETILEKIGDINDKYLNIGAVHGPIERKLMYQFFFTTVFTRPEKRLIELSMDSNKDYAITINVNAAGSNIVFQEEVNNNDEYTLTRK